MKPSQRQHIQDRRWILSSGVVLLLTLFFLSACAPAPTAMPLPTALRATAIATPRPTDTPPLPPMIVAKTPVEPTPEPPQSTPTSAPDIMRTPDGYQQVVAPTSLLFANGDTSGYDHASPSSAFATFPFNPAEEVRFDITAKSADTSASSGIVLGVPQTEDSMRRSVFSIRTVDGWYGTMAHKRRLLRLREAMPPQPTWRG